MPALVLGCGPCSKPELAMRIGLVIDSACDLPDEFIRAHGITILPISVRSDLLRFVDNRDAEATLRFFRNQLGDRAHDAETEPLSVPEVRELFLRELVTRYDAVVVLTISAARSQIFANTQQASFSILKDYHAPRRAAGLETPFLMRVMDTQTLFAGQVPSAWEAVRLIGSGAGAARIRERLEALLPDCYGYFLPRDLYYLRARAQKRGDRSVGWLSATLGSALDIKPIIRGWRKTTEPVGKVRGFEHGAQVLFEHAAQRVEAGLLVPVVALSYGGELDALRALPGYTALRDSCDQHGVQLTEAVMSMTAMVNVGAGGLTVGFASSAYDARF